MVSRLANPHAGLRTHIPAGGSASSAGFHQPSSWGQGSVTDCRPCTHHRAATNSFLSVSVHRSYETCGTTPYTEGRKCAVTHGFASQEWKDTYIPLCLIGWATHGHEAGRVLSDCWEQTRSSRRFRRHNYTEGRRAAVTLSRLHTPVLKHENHKRWSSLQAPKHSWYAKQITRSTP